MPRTLAYSVLDVFAEAPLAGNPLAVFHDATGLTDAEMQALARETNLSETTFVFPGEADAAEGVRVRIFTTEEELPFAGHPTLGTASWLRLHHPSFADATELTLRLNIGPIRVTFAPSPSAGEGVVATMRQRDPVFAEVYPVATVAPLLALAPEDFLPGHSPQAVSTGNFFCVTALKDVTTLERLSIPQQLANPWLKAHGMRWFYVLAPAGPNHWRARMQWLSGEDPATGSAAGPAIAWLVQQGLVPPDTDVTIEQGVEMHRRSVLVCRASRDGNSVHAVDVSGRTIPVAVGNYFV